MGFCPSRRKKMMAPGEVEKFMEFLEKETKYDNYPADILELCEGFRKKTQAKESLNCLMKLLVQQRTKIHTMDFDLKTKVKLSFVLCAPIDPEFLKSLQNDANVKVDKKNRIIRYVAKNGSLKLSTNKDLDAIQTKIGGKKRVQIDSEEEDDSGPSTSSVVRKKFKHGSSSSSNSSKSSDNSAQSSRKSAENDKKSKDSIEKTPSYTMDLPENKENSLNESISEFAPMDDDDDDLVMLEGPAVEGPVDYSLPIIYIKNEDENETRDFQQQYLPFLTGNFENTRKISPEVIEADIIIDNVIEGIKEAENPQNLNITSDEYLKMAEIREDLSPFLFENDRKSENKDEEDDCIILAENIVESGNLKLAPPPAPQMFTENPDDYCEIVGEMTENGVVKEEDIIFEGVIKSSTWKPQNSLEHFLELIRDVSQKLHLSKIIEKVDELIGKLREVSERTICMQFISRSISYMFHEISGNARPSFPANEKSTSLIDFLRHLNVFCFHRSHVELVGTQQEIAQKVCTELLGKDLKVKVSTIHVVMKDTLFDIAAQHNVVLIV